MIVCCLCTLYRRAVSVNVLRCTEMCRFVTQAAPFEAVPALEVLLAPAGLRAPRRADVFPASMALLVLDNSAGDAAANGSPI
jgi:hypothetical protein